MLGNGINISVNFLKSSLINWDKLIIGKDDINTGYFFYNELGVTRIDLTIIIKNATCYISKPLIIKTKL